MDTREVLLGKTIAFGKVMIIIIENVAELCAWSTDDVPRC
jgi:hypothetical protein